LPAFLSGHVDEHEQEGSLLLLNAGILVMTATLVGVAITLSWGNPVKVFADVSASRTDFSARWRGTDQSTPKIQLTAAQVLRRLRGERRPATKLLPPLNPPVRVRPQSANHQPKPC
jgi:hypothetical protein